MCSISKPIKGVSRKKPSPNCSNCAWFAKKNPDQGGFCEPLRFFCETPFSPLYMYTSAAVYGTPIGTALDIPFRTAFIIAFRTAFSVPFIKALDVAFRMAVPIAAQKTVRPKVATGDWFTARGASRSNREPFTASSPLGSKILSG